MRLFVAVCLNDAVRESLTAATRQLQRQALRGQFPPPENLHLTLHFLGETERIPAVCRAIDSVACAPFGLTVTGLGRFRRTDGDIVWAGIQADDGLYTLQQQLGAALRQQGFALESREYRPHLTMGRQVVLQNGWESACQIVLPPMTMPVNSVHLMKSERVKGQMVYTSLYERRLSDPCS